MRRLNELKKLGKPLEEPKHPELEVAIVPIPPKKGGKK